MFSSYLLIPLRNYIQFPVIKCVVVLEVVKDGKELYVDQFVVIKRNLEDLGFACFCLITCLLARWLHSCPDEMRVPLLKEKREIHIGKASGGICHSPV